MLGLFKKFRNRTPQKTLPQAIEEAGESLRNILKDQSLRVVLVNSVDSPVLSDIKKWNYINARDSRKHSKRPKFGWDGQISLSQKYDSTYIVALYSGNTLCGLCENHINKNENFVRSRNIEISKIEGNPSNHALQGYLVAAFTQVNLSVAQALKAHSLSVFIPDQETKNSYFRLGYRAVSSSVTSLFKPVNANTELDWALVFEHQKSKGRQIPSLS